jgi:hypothetical protein
MLLRPWKAPATPHASRSSSLLLARSQFLFPYIGLLPAPAVLFLSSHVTGIDFLCRLQNLEFHYVTVQRLTSLYSYLVLFVACSSPNALKGL